MTLPATISWSTELARPGRRLEAWRSFLGQTYDACDMDYDAGDDFWASMWNSDFGDISIGRIAGARRSAIRHPAQAARGEDGAVMSIAVSGRYYLEQGRRSHVLEPGEADFYHNCMPGRFAAEGRGEYWMIGLPASVLAPRLGDTSALAALRIGAASPELRLLTAYLSAISATDGLDDSGTRALLARQIVDLVVLTARGRSEEDAGESSGRGVRAARYRLVLDEINRRYAEPMLNGERIARALGISERYVQQLFEEHAGTVSQHILAVRLDAALKALTDPAQDGRTIADIAYACGFSDVSYFNRCFKRSFGETPNRVRHSGAAFATA